MNSLSLDRGAPADRHAAGTLRQLDRLSCAVDRGIECLGRISAWLTLVLVLMVSGDVIARYVWHAGSVAEQELQWHILAVISMLSASFTFQQGEHVRVDIFYQNYSPRTKQVLEVLIPLFVVVPCMLFIAWASLDFVYQSWLLGEGSPDPGGLPARYMIKAFVPLGFSLIALQGFATGLHNLVELSVAAREPRDGR